MVFLLCFNVLDHPERVLHSKQRSFDSDSSSLRSNICLLPDNRYSVDNGRPKTRPESRQLHFRSSTSVHRHNSTIPESPPNPRWDKRLIECQISLKNKINLSKLKLYFFVVLYRVDNIELYCMIKIGDRLEEHSFLFKRSDMYLQEYMRSKFITRVYSILIVQILVTIAFILLSMFYRPFYHFQRNHI